jgi:hypothetical protein
MEEDEIESQLLYDTDSDCATDDSKNGEEESDFEIEVNEEPSCSSATWGPPDQHGKSGVNNYSGRDVGLNTNEAPHVNKESKSSKFVTPLGILMT